MYSGGSSRNAPSDELRHEPRRPPRGHAAERVADEHGGPDATAAPRPRRRRSRRSGTRPASARRAVAAEVRPHDLVPRDQRLGVEPAVRARLPARPSAGRRSVDARGSSTARNISPGATMDGVRYLVLTMAALLVVVAVAFAQDPAPPPSRRPRRPTPPRRPTRPTRRRRRRSTRHSRPTSPRSPGTTPRRSAARAQGPARDGVQLPELGEDFFTWDPIYNRIPNRDWRRWGTDRLIRTVLTVLHEYRTERDSAQRVGIMDLSRRTAASSAATTAGSATRRTRTASTPTSSTRARTAPRRARSSPHRSIASSRRTSSTASSPPAP